MRAFGNGIGQGVLDTFGAGTAIRFGLLPPLAPDHIPDNASQEERARLEALIADRLTEEEYRASPWYDETLPYEQGLTNARAREKARGLGSKEVRLMYMGRSPIAASLAPSSARPSIRSTSCRWAPADHAIEQKVFKLYGNVLTKEEMHGLGNLRGIPLTKEGSRLHRSFIRDEWSKFYESHPVATKEQLMAKARDIDRRFGHLFRPPV